MQQEKEKNEIKLLSFIWQNQGVLPVAMTELKDEYFSSADNKAIFTTLREAYSNIKGELNANVIGLPRPMVYKLTAGDFSKNIGRDPSQVYQYLIKRVLDDYKKTQVINLLSHTASDIKINDVKEINNILEGIYKEASKLKVLGENTVQQGSASEDTEERKNDYIERKTNPEVVNLVKTGFKTIDDTNGGFTPGELIYIIGRKGDGKSVLMLNFAYHIWRQNKNVILFSLEISRKDYMRRFDARAALVPSKGLKLGTLNEQDEKKFFHYLENLQNHKSPTGKPVGTFYVVDVPGKCTPAFVDSKTEEIEQKLNIKFDAIIVDYAQIMEPNIRTDVKRDNLGAIALDLKRIARNKKKIVISAAQMTRAGKNDTSQKNGHAGTEHVAESDQISDHLDWGIAIRSISDENGVIESFKTRDGEPFEFHFEKQYDKMNIIETSKEDWDAVLEKNKDGSS